MKKNAISNTMHRIDQKLLLNKRLLWETKIHYFLGFIAVSYVFTILISFLTPVSLNSEFPEMTGIVTLLTVINALAFCYWVYRQSQYSIEGQFGISPKYIEQLRFLIYFGGVTLLIAQPFIPNLIVDAKVDNLITFAELREDVEILNEGNMYFPTSGYEDNTDNIFSIKNGFNEVSEEDELFTSNYPYKDDLFGDVEGIGENWEHSEGYNPADDPTKEEVLLVIENAKKPENIAKIERFVEIFKKYDKEGLKALKNIEAQKVLDDFRAEKVAIGDKINKYSVKGRIGSIESRKENNAFRNYYGTTIGGILLTSFCLAMVMQIGRHLGLKNFILGVVFNIGLSMFAGLFGAFLSMGMGIGMLMGLVVPAGYVFLWVQGNSIKFLKAKSVFKQLCLSTAQLYSPFLLIYIYASGLTLGDSNSGSVEGAVFMTVLGCVLYVAVMLPYFRKLHLRMRALPSD